MKISKNAYGFIIISIFLGVLIITHLAGIWDVSVKSDANEGSRHAMSTLHYAGELYNN